MLTCTHAYNYKNNYVQVHGLLQYVGETGASCYNFQLKSLFVKSTLDALFPSTYTLSLLFVLINCAIPLIFHIVVR